MARKNKWYDLPAANALFKYAEENYKLTATDKKVYRALQSLESQQDGISKDVVANHRTIKRAAKIALGTVRVSLERLRDQGLIEYTAGDRDYAKHKASRIRRKSITELEEERKQKQPAYQLAAIMNKRYIQYGEKRVRPSYRVGITNRLYASDPNVQSKKDIRADWLAQGCNKGEVLLETEWTQIYSLYPDIPSFRLKALSLEEAMSEKVRALITRRKARDAYDIWYLLKMGVGLDNDLVQKKLTMYDMKLDRSLTKEVFGEIGSVWEKELRALMASPPEFKQVKQDIEKYL